MSYSNDAINQSEHDAFSEHVVPTKVSESASTPEEPSIPSKGNSPLPPIQPSATPDLNNDAKLEEHSAAVGMEEEETEGKDVAGSEDEVDGGLEDFEAGVEEIEEIVRTELVHKSVEMAASASQAAMAKENMAFDDHEKEPTDENEDGIALQDTTMKYDDPMSADREVGDTSTDHAISRTASPASNASTGQIRPSSASASAPKKFSSMNINKKFLGKTAVVAPMATAPNFGGLGLKPVGSLGSLGARPSSSPSGSQTSSSRILTSVKLTKTASASTPPVSSSSVTPPPMGWSRPSIDAAQSKSDGPSEPTSSGLGNLRKPMFSSNQSGPMGLSMGLLGTKKKKGWGSVPEAGRTGPVLPGSSKEFPTAKEVVDGQRQAALHAQMAAQAQAAHHQALLQGLDSFRSRKRDDPNAHYWDEDDDEGNFDQVLDFGDGATYTIPAAMPQEVSQPLESDRPNEEPVSKEQRFADDFDRSWPPKQPVAPPLQPPRGQFDSRDNGREAAMAHQARVLFNERSNKLEAPSGGERPRKQLPPPAQLLTRNTDVGRTSSGRAGPPSGFDRAPPPHLAAQDHAPPGPPSGLARREPPPHVGGGMDRIQGRELPPHAPQQAAPPSHLPLGSLALGNRRESQHAESHQRPTGLLSMPSVPQRQADPARTVNAASSWRNDALAFDKSSLSSLPPVVSPLADLRSPPRQMAHLVQVIPLPAAAQPPVNLTDMQKDEMHSAAERAKARREAEEAEREAQKERARRKAKELEERMQGQGSAASVPVVNAQAPLPSNATVAPRRTTLLQRPQRPESQQDIASQRNSGLPAPQWDTRPALPAPQRGPVQGTVPSAFAPLRPSAEDIPSRSLDKEQIIQIDSTVPTERPAAISPTSAVLSRGDRPQAIAVAALKSVRPEILERSTWRRSAEVTAKDSQADGVNYDREISVSSYLQPSPVNGVKRSPVLSPAAEAPSTGTLVVPSGLPPPGIPPIEQNRSGVMLQTPSGKPQSKEPSSTSFDDIMARIKSVMVNEQEQRKTALEVSPSKGIQQPQLPPPQPQPLESPVPIRARVRAPVSAAPPRPTAPPFIPGPRPANFLMTRSPTPEVPPPAWKTQLVKLPRASRVPHSTSRTARLNTLPVPSDFLTSWEPPLAQLNPNTLSRDEIFIGQKYFRGRLVTIVKLPPPHALRWVQPDVEADLPVDLAETPEFAPPQTLQRPIIASGPRKVVVRLPSTSRSIGGLPAETASDLDTPEATDLLPIPAHDQPPALTRQKSPRRLDTGNAVSFAKPQPSGAGSEAKTSVRFLMESQLEDNASNELLDEVLQTSQDAMDGPLDEEEAQPLTPAFSNALEKKVGLESGSAAAASADVLAMQMEAALVSPPAKSGPASPTTSSAKRSNVYPVSQSPGRVVDRNHIKSVWSQTAGNDIGSSSNSLEGITDELPQFSMPMHDLPEGKDEPDATETKDIPNGGQEDLDIPQFASVGAVKSEAASSPGVANGYATYPMDPRMLNQSQSPYGQVNSTSHGPSPASSYQYAAGGNGMAPQYSGSGYSGTPLSAQTPNQYMGVHRLASDGSGVQQPNLSMHGIPGQLQHQMGVWMPASQHQNGSMQSGAAGPTGLYTGGGAQKRPGPTMSDYRGMTHGQDSLYGAAASNMGSGIYSNATGGPLDSPVASFARPYAAPSAGNGQYGMNLGYGSAGGSIGYGSGGQRYQPSSGGAGGIGQRNMYGSVNSRGGPYSAGNGGDYNPAVGSSTYQNQQQLHGQIGRGSGSQSTGYGHVDVGKGAGGGAMGGSSPQRPGMGMGAQHQRHASAGGMGGRTGGFVRGSGSGAMDRGPW